MAAGVGAAEGVDRGPWRARLSAECGVRNAEWGNCGLPIADCRLSQVRGTPCAKLKVQVSRITFHVSRIACHSSHVTRHSSRPMLSHRYEFTVPDAARAVALPLIPVAVFALAMHLGAALRLLPAPRPAYDVDRTVLLHQTCASRAKHQADLLLLGDSACLMDVNAARLGELLGRRALNLSTLSYLSLPGHGRLLREYVAANPGQLRTVVLLLHPGTLRLQAQPADYDELLANYIAGRDSFQTATGQGQLNRWLGLEVFRGRLLSRFLPFPLPGQYGLAYGFTTDLWHRLDERQGGVTDPHHLDLSSARGSAEFRLARQFERQSRQFHNGVPHGVKLVVGLTPVPESFAQQNHAQTCQQMLEQLAGWLGADAMLTNLPATLPDELFASVTHLNARGADRFTDLLAKSAALPPHW